MTSYNCQELKEKVAALQLNKQSLQASIADAIHVSRWTVCKMVKEGIILRSLPDSDVFQHKSHIRKVMFLAAVARPRGLIVALTSGRMKRLLCFCSQRIT